MTPRRIRNYRAPERKPRPSLAFGWELTPEQAAHVRGIYPKAVLEPAPFGFRIMTPPTWRDRIRGWFA